MPSGMGMLTCIDAASRRPLRSKIAGRAPVVDPDAQEAGVDDLPMHHERWHPARSKLQVG